MTAINFPSNPTNGQTIIIGSTTYTYNSTYSTWDLVASVIQGTDGAPGPAGPAGEANFSSFLLMGS